MPTRPDRFPILQARPAHDLINNLTRAQKELAEIQLTPEQKLTLDRWVDVEFVCAALALEGFKISREDVRDALTDAAPGASGNTEDEFGIVSALNAISAVRALAEAHGRAALLTPALIVQLHSGLNKETPRHNEAGGDQSIAGPAAITRTLAQLESACHWFEADSFAELHAAEQASIVLMRLIELKPFDEGNTRTALAASSLFTLRSGLPPIIIKPEMEAAYRAALNQGMRMNTRPMVDLVTEALFRAVDEMVVRIRGK